MQVQLIVLRFLTRVIDFLSQTRSYFLCLPHEIFKNWLPVWQLLRIMNKEGIGKVWMYILALERSWYLIVFALLLHPFSKTVIHHSLILLYVSVSFLLTRIMWSVYMQPDTKLICLIEIIVVLSDFGQVHITLSRKWHNVPQELEEAPAGQLLLWGRYYIPSQHCCSCFYVLKSCKECCDGLYHTFLISVTTGCLK